jgi:hypothetical protein
VIATWSDVSRVKVLPQFSRIAPFIIASSPFNKYQTHLVYFHSHGSCGIKVNSHDRLAIPFLQHRVLNCLYMQILEDLLFFPSQNYSSGRMFCQLNCPFCGRHSNPSAPSKTCQQSAPTSGSCLIGIGKGPRVKGHVPRLTQCISAKRDVDLRSDFPI